MSDERVDGEILLKEGMRGALERLSRGGGSLNRLVVQGDQGFIVVCGAKDEEDLKLIAAAGRALDRRLSEDEAQHLYTLGYRRYNAARSYEREVSVDDSDTLDELVEEIVGTMTKLYASSADAVALHEKYGDRVEVKNSRLIEAMRRLSKDRDMSARQKLYWALIRADVLLALEKPAPASLSSERGLAQWIESGLKDIDHISASITLLDFKEITSYRSASVFGSYDALERVDPRGTHFIQVPGRLAVMIALAQGWSSLLIDPRSEVGGELYRNELESIRDGLKQLGW